MVMKMTRESSNIFRYFPGVIGVVVIISDGNFFCLINRDTMELRGGAPPTRDRVERQEFPGFFREVEQNRAGFKPDEGFAMGTVGIEILFLTTKRR